MNSGDTVTVSGIRETINFVWRSSDPNAYLDDVQNLHAYITDNGNRSGAVEITYDDFTFTAGDQMTPITAKLKIYEQSSFGTPVIAVTVTRTFMYGDGTLRILCEQTGNNIVEQIEIPALSGVSTKAALGDPTYIDLELGEAWLESNDSVVSLNNIVGLPAELPTLKSGETEITFTGSISDLKIIPRWCKL